MTQLLMDYSVESVQKCGVQQLEGESAQVAEIIHIHCIVCDLKRGLVYWKVKSGIENVVGCWGFWE